MCLVHLITFHCNLLEMCKYLSSWNLNRHLVNLWIYYCECLNFSLLISTVGAEINAPPAIFCVFSPLIDVPVKK